MNAVALGTCCPYYYARIQVSRTILRIQAKYDDKVRRPEQNANAKNAGKNADTHLAKNATPTSGTPDRVVFNNPEYCATTPSGESDPGNPDVNGCAFGGSDQVTDAFGCAHFQPHVLMRDDPGLDRPFAGAGLVTEPVDPFEAEIRVLDSPRFKKVLNATHSCYRSFLGILFESYSTTTARHQQ